MSPARTSAEVAPAPGMRWEGRAPAKINLLFRVLAREEGGYHQVETLYQALELGDGVALEIVEEPGIRIQVGGPEAEGVPVGESNLAFRAARSYLRRIGRSDSLGVRIELAKRIPHGAGLGGGSSDAAAVLRGLDVLHGHPLGASRLAEAGAELGADVGFFVLDRALAFAWGRGDRLLCLPALPARDVLLVVPSEPISTPWAYERLAEHRAEAGGVVLPALVLGPHPFGSWEEVEEKAENAFHEALEALRPELQAIRTELAVAGARPALLAGSGSVVFGICPDVEVLARAEERIAHSYPEAHIVRTSTRTGPPPDEPGRT